MSGRFQRDLGWLALGKQKRFYLGREESEAKVRVARLEQLWESVQRCGASTWPAEALAVADAVRQGQPTSAVPRKDGQTDAQHYELVRLYGDLYRGIRFVPSDSESYDRGRMYTNASNEWLKRSVEQDVRMEKIDAENARHQYLTDFIPARDDRAASLTHSPHTLHKVLEDFALWAKENYRGRSSSLDEAAETSDYGKNLASTVLRHRRAHADIPLDAFDEDVIRGIVKFWIDRPRALTHANRGKNKRVSPRTVTNQIKGLRAFVKWLGRNRKTYGWSKPDDVNEYLRLPTETDLMAEDEVAELRRGVRTFDLEQLTTLYEYATDHERAFLLVGLNMAFAQSECRSFRISEIDCENDRTLVKRIRRKSKVYGEFSLWPETLRALKWLELERAKYAQPENSLVFITKQGKRPTRQRISTTWEKLLQRVRKDHPDFPPLSFKFLRKTAAQIMLDHGGEEEGDGGADEITVALFLCHGQPVKSDFHADRYYRRKFRRVFRALDHVHEYLAPMFAAAPDAFTPERKQERSVLSRRTIQRIRELDARGVSRSEIVRTVGVARATVYRYVNPKTKPHDAEQVGGGTAG